LEGDKGMISVKLAEVKQQRKLVLVQMHMQKYNPHQVADDNSSKFKESTK